jgi:hypothetical protein
MHCDLYAKYFDNAQLLKMRFALKAGQKMTDPRQPHCIHFLSDVLMQMKNSSKSSRTYDSTFMYQQSIL